MKFNTKHKFTFILILTIVLQLLNATEIKTKRSESMMEYLNNFFNTDEVENVNHNHIKRSHNSRSNSYYKFKEENSNMNFAEAAADNSTLSQNTTAKGNSTNSTNDSDLLQDWWEISSSAFKNTFRFPPVKLLDGSTLIIKSDSNNFRINSAFEHMQEGDKPPAANYFWFRLSGINIYYSSSKSDLNILGVISIRDIADAENLNSTNSQGLYCINIDDAELHKWHMCCPKKETSVKWYCRIKKLLGLKDDLCDNPNKPKPIIIEKQITQPIVIIPVPSRQCNEGWDYKENGDNWECDCSEGKEQSPIDLPTPDKAIDSTVRPYLEYDEITKGLKIKHEDNMLKIKNAKFGKLVTMDGAVYHAQEIQIHTPGEHTINGKSYDMEIQIIHWGASKGDIAKQAVLSFPIEKTPGVYNKFIDDLDFFNLPNPLIKEKEISSLFIPKIFHDSDEEDSLIGLKPFSFYTYQGSLTAPPCFESTIMFVAKPIKLGSTAIKLFQEALRMPDLMNAQGDVTISNTLPFSNRNTQPKNGRPVFYYDHTKYCPPEPVKKPQGHYEKVKKPMTNYFYVHGNEPSGLPGSLIVSEEEATGIPKDNKPQVKKKTIQFN